MLKKRYVYSVLFLSVFLLKSLFSAEATWNVDYGTNWEPSYYWNGFHRVYTSPWTGVEDSYTPGTALYGDIANLTYDLAGIGMISVTINGNYVLGELQIGDPENSSTANGYTLLGGDSSYYLTFNNNGSGASIVHVEEVGTESTTKLSDEISIPIVLADNLTITTNNDDSESLSTRKHLLISGTITGEDGYNITKNGIGTLLLSGISTDYTGTITISEGTIRCGYENILPNIYVMDVESDGVFDLDGYDQNIPFLKGSGSVTLGGGTLTITGDEDKVEFSGCITETGNLIKAGTGTFVLTGDNDYVGTTTINEGKLIVNGSIQSSDVTVNSGSILAGFGVVDQNVTVNSGGSLMPGTSIGSFYIGGDLHLKSGSIYEVEATRDGADCTYVVGTSTIDTESILQVVPVKDEVDLTSRDLTINSSVTTDSLLILHADGGVNGTFTDVSIYPGFDMVVEYDSNNVWLVIKTKSFDFLVEDGNSGSVANYSEELINQSYADQGTCLYTVLADIQTMSTLDEMSYAFDQMHCAIYKGVILAQENSTVRLRERLTERLSNLYRASCVHGNDLNQASFWVSPFVDKYHHKHQNDVRGFKGDAAGGLIGCDANLVSNHYLGIAGGYTNSSLDYDTKVGHSDIDTGYGFLYYAWYDDSLYANCSIFGGRSKINSSRKIIFGDIDLKNSTDHHAQEYGAHVDFGFLLSPKNKFDLRPFILADFIYFQEKGFSENGASCIDLSVKSSDSMYLRTEIGTHFSQCFETTRKMIFDCKLSYVREDRFKGKQYTCNFVDLPGSFTVTGIRGDKNLIAPGVSFSVFSLNKKRQFLINYSGEIGAKVCNNLASMQLLFNF